MWAADDSLYRAGTHTLYRLELVLGIVTYYFSFDFLICIYCTDDKMTTATQSLFSFSIGFAECAHISQKRKYTNEAYAVHCRNVAKLVYRYFDYHESINLDSVVAAAALHDVLEDTSITEAQLRGVFGDVVADLVLEVTDISKPKDGNREIRKKIDREHLIGCSPEAATIKLADLIDNTESIVKYDLGFAKIYLAEKALLLPHLSHGEKVLYLLAQETLVKAQLQLCTKPPMKTDNGVQTDIR